MSGHCPRLLEKAAPAIAENKRLQESVKTLEASLANAHGDKERLQLRVAQLEFENWSLTDWLGTTETDLIILAEQKKGKSL